MRARTDRHNNPIAFTTAIAKQAGLIEGTDYTVGDPFGTGYFTARILGDPVATCLRVIDALGFYTKAGGQRWVYIGLPPWVWALLTTDEQRRRIVGDMYAHEGGTEMKGLFPSV